jgi:hypothetical protein
MALKVILRDRTGADKMSHDLPADMTIYPEVLLKANDVYILRRVMPDKRSAIYFEARVFKIAGGP